MQVKEQSMAYIESVSRDLSPAEGITGILKVTSALDANLNVKEQLSEDAKVGVPLSKARVALI